MIVHRPSAVWSLDCALLIVQLRVNVVTVVLGIRIVRLLIAIEAVVRRLPSERGVHVRAIVAAAIRLSIARGRLENLRRVVARRWVGSQRRTRLRIAGRNVRILRRRLRARRWLQLITHVRRNTHASIHGTHVEVGCLPLQRCHAIEADRWGSIGVLTHRRLAIRGEIILFVGSLATLTRHRCSRSQGGGCGGFRLFDGSGVMILMSCQGGAASERLLTISVGAFVWALARVDAAVARKGAGITKRLYVELVESK